MAFLLKNGILSRIQSHINELDYAEYDLKNLKKDPAYYTNQLAEESIKLVGAYGSGKKPGNQTKESAEKVKAEVSGPKDETPGKDKANELKTIGKVEKANVSKDKKPTNSNTVTKAKQETYTAKKAKGIKSTMDLPGKEKKININENKEYQGMASYQPGSSDANDWDQGVDIEIKSKVDDKLKDKVIKRLQKRGIDAKFRVSTSDGKNYLRVADAGDDYNAAEELDKLGIKYYGV